MKALEFGQLHFLLLAVLFTAACSQVSDKEKEQLTKETVQPVPVFYSSDLWLPHGDPDDHFDLLTLLSIPELDPKVILIDHTMQSNVKRTGIPKEPNFQAVEKAIELYGRSPIPTAAGLIEPLKDPKDQGLDRPMEEQAAINLLLEQLPLVEDSSAVFITTGSVRDVVAAYNRQPDLFKAKIKTIFISMGDSYGINGTLDTNVKKDIEAWKGLMRSDLPISWMPTNPSKRRGGVSRYVSYWHFVQEEVLTEAPKSIQDFFLSEGVELALSRGRPVRSMWSTPAFIEAAGLRCYEVDGSLSWMPPKNAANLDANEKSSYSFVPVQVEVSDAGDITWKETDAPSNVRIFKMEDHFLYNEAMTVFLQDQLNKVTEEQTRD